MMNKYVLLTVFVAALFVSSPTQSSDVQDKETYCLAQNIYFEARGQSFAGQVDVSNVVLNRVRNKSFPNTICGVVKQGKHVPSWKDKTKLIPLRNKCAFSWYCDGKTDKPHNKKMFNHLYQVAEKVRTMMIDITGGALYYHSIYVNPWWAEHFTKTTLIDNHVFYKK